MSGWLARYAVFYVRTHTLCSRWMLLLRTLRVRIHPHLSFHESIESRLMHSQNLREREIDGFCKRFAELVAEGDYVMADYLADCVFSLANATDNEYEQILSAWGPIN